MKQLPSFKDFLLEAQEFQVEKFKVMCKPAIDHFRKSGRCLYHGSKFAPADWAGRQWKPREKPLSTPIVVHNLVNDYVVDKFNEPIRNWMFATGDKEIAKLYGSMTAIFPVGDFQWACNKGISDMTGSYNRELYKIASFDKPTIDDEKQACQKLIDLLDDAGWWFNTDLAKCLHSNNELMFKCDKYFMFNMQGETFKKIISPLLAMYYKDEQ